MKLNRGILTAAAAALFVGVTAPAGAQVVGTFNSANCIPFGCSYPEPNAGSIYQQVYASSNFATGGMLTGLSFFNDPAFKHDLRAGTYDFYLSTTSVAVNALDASDFDSNRGLDNTFWGSFALSGATPDVLSFTGSGFNYDPALGNLLLDIRISGASPQIHGGPDESYFQAEYPAGGTFSRDYNFSANGSDNVGLVTGFTFGPSDPGGDTVPEPATMTLLATGLAGMAAARRRKKNA